MIFLLSKLLDLIWNITVGKKNKELMIKLQKDGASFFTNNQLQLGMHQFQSPTG